MDIPRKQQQQNSAYRPVPPDKTKLLAQNQKNESRSAAPARTNISGGCCPAPARPAHRTRWRTGSGSSGDLRPAGRQRDPASWRAGPWRRGPAPAGRHRRRNGRRAQPPARPNHCSPVPPTNISTAPMDKISSVPDRCGSSSMSTVTDPPESARTAQRLWKTDFILS